MDRHSLTQSGRRAQRRAPAWHVIALAALVAVAGARGLYWVAITDLWQGDEAQHYGYVASLAGGEGIPEVGVDLVPAEVLQTRKLGPVDGTLSTELSASPDDERWGPARQQYAGIHGPTTAALLTPAFLLAADLTTVERLYLLRALTMAVTLTAIPLLWLVARALFPGQRRAWLLAPALLAGWQAFSAGGAALDEDALVLPLATAALLGAALTYRDGPGVGNAALTGLAAGLALVTGAGALVIAPPLALLALAAALRHRPRPWRALAWVLGAAAGAAVSLVPWLLHLRAVYGGVGGALARLTAVLGPEPPLAPATLPDHWRDSLTGLFGHEPVGAVSYTPLVLGMVVAAALAGLLAVVRRREREQALVLGVLVLALPLGLLTTVGAHALLGAAAARRPHALLPLLALLVAVAWLLALGRRAGTVAVVVVIAVALQLEVPLSDRYVEARYQRGLPAEVPGVIPVVLQDVADRYAPLPVVQVAPPCPARLVALAFPGDPPAALELLPGEPSAAPRVAVERVGTLRWGYYDTAGRAESFTARAGGAPLASQTGQDLDPALALEGGPGDPVARVYCDSEDPQQVRFGQLFWPQHPDLPLPLVRAWPRVVAVAGLVALAVAMLAAALPGPQAPPRPQRVEEGGAGLPLPTKTGRRRGGAHRLGTRPRAPARPTRT